MNTGRPILPRLLATLIAASLLSPQALYGQGRGRRDTGGTSRDSVRVLEWTDVHWDEAVPLVAAENGFHARFAGQVIERTVQLPAALAAPRIVARVQVEPKFHKEGKKLKPNDPWPRLGSINAVVPDATGKLREIELMRFVTGYGARGRFEQDVTALAPILTGLRTFRVCLAAFGDRPGWRVSFELVYFHLAAGYRKPSLVLPLFDDLHVAGDRNGRAKLVATVVIPEGLARPRLRIITTGHATNGKGDNEFVTAPHILRIDGQEVARWRPWSEDGVELRPDNPWAFRRKIEGREVWSSDFDRSGWHPGRAVKPVMIPVPELQPGSHRVELELTNLTPAPPTGKHGYWVINAAVVADQPWSELTGESQ